MPSSVLAEVFEHGARCFPHNHRHSTQCCRQGKEIRDDELGMIDKEGELKNHDGGLIPQQRSPKTSYLRRRLEVYARIVRSITKRPPILLGAHCRVTDLRWILIDDRQISILYYFLFPLEITRTNQFYISRLIVGPLVITKLRSHLRST